MTEVDHFAHLYDTPTNFNRAKPSKTRKAPSLLPKAKRRGTGKKLSGLTYPRWFASDHAQAAAEAIAFNVYLDRMMGLPMTIAKMVRRWPYSAYKLGAVSGFLTRLGIVAI